MVAYKKKQTKIEPKVEDGINLKESSKSLWESTNQEKNKDIEEPVVKVYEEKYYLQVNISNLYDYYGLGLIIPSSLILERTKRDIQSEFPNRILLSKGYFSELEPTECLIEIKIKKEDKSSDSYDTLFIEKPIPITRIHKIYVFDEKTKQKILNTATSQDVGYIPLHLFDFFPNDIRRIEKPVPIQADEFTYQKKLNAFDKILGLFSFIKNQQLYYTNNTGLISNFSNHFLDALSAINSQVEIDLRKYIRPDFVQSFRMLFDYNNTDDSQPNSFLIKNIYDGVLFDNELVKKFFEKFSILYPDKQNNVLELSTNLLNQIGRKNSLQGLLEINDKFFKMAYLYIYGKKGTNDKEILKNLIYDELPYNQSEITLALLGLYYGYKDLRISEKIEFNDIKIKRYLGSEHNLKFRLDNELDYVIIESVFEFVFNERPSNKQSLPSLQYFAAKKPVIELLKNDPDFEIEFDISVFNCSYFKAKKLTNCEIISKAIKIYPEKLNNYLHLVSYIKKYYDEDHYLIRGQKGYVFKSEFIRLFEDKNIILSNPEHFNLAIDLDKKFNLR